jgi:hypothetical protein
VTGARRACGSETCQRFGGAQIYLCGSSTIGRRNFEWLESLVSPVRVENRDGRPAASSRRRPTLSNEPKIGYIKFQRVTNGQLRTMCKVFGIMCVSRKIVQDGAVSRDDPTWWPETGRRIQRRIGLLSPLRDDDPPRRFDDYRSSTRE